MPATHPSPLTLLQQNQFGLPVEEHQLIMPIEGSVIGKWDIWLEPWIGQDWTRVPAWVAEAWYARKYLSDRNYFEQGESHLVDFWAAEKVVERLYPVEILDQIAEYFQNPETFFANHILLGALFNKIRSHQGGKARILTDFCGQELVENLIFTHFLLKSEVFSEISLDFYQFPFKQLATTQDYYQLLTRIFQGGVVCMQFGLELNQFTLNQNLKIATHAWWNSPCFFTQLDTQLQKMYAESSLVLLRGKLSRRRLCEDRPQVSYNNLGSYLPCQIISDPE
ncbi:MAG: DUF89 family protein [Bacteroidia bacterium]|nr:DUF89 family protein [Bacteroidia bacterium]